MKAVIYVRVSTSEQALEGYSLSAQINTLKDYAKAYGYTVLKIYQDAGISGKNIKDRPALLDLLEAAKESKFDIVLVWKLSRLSRSLLDLLNIMGVLSSHNVAFQSFSEKFDTSTPMGKMLLQLLGSISEFERNTIAENVKMGLAERFKQGFSKGAIPFGYNPENKKAVIDTEKAELVKYVFEQYSNSADGNCLTNLADYLNSNGHKTRTNGIWTRVAIRDMLLNHFYAGFVRTGIHSHGYQYKNASVIKGSHDPIISEELFNNVNNRLKDNKRNAIIRQPDNESVLTGLVNCPRCGAKMFALNSNNRHKAKDGHVYDYPVRIYRCTNLGKGDSFCKGFYLSGKKIEPFVLNLITKYAENGFIESKKFKDKTVIKPNQQNKQLELKKLYAIKEKYFKLYELDKLDMNLFADKLTDISNKIEQLEVKKEITPTLKNIDVFINDFTETYQELTNYQKKELLREFIYYVEINLDKKVTGVKLLNGILLS